MASYVWNVDADGDWSDAANWNPAGPPTAGSDVTIDTADAHTVTYGADSGALTIDSLTIYGNTETAPDLFSITGGALTIASTSNFSAGLNILGGGLALGDGATSTIAGLTITGPGTLSVGGNKALANIAGGGSASGDALSAAAGGTLEFGGGTFTVNDGTYDIAGTTLVAAGTLDLSGALTIMSLGGDGLVVTGGSLELGGNDGSAGSLFQNSGIIDGTGTLTIAGAASLGDSATETGAGTTLLDGTTKIGLGGNFQLLLDGGRILENAGTLNWTGNTIDLGVGSDNSGATIENDAEADFNIETDNSVAVGDGATGIFDNAGTLTKSVTTGTTRINAVFDNTGAVAVDTGTLQLVGGGSSDAGAFTAAADATLEFAGGTFAMTGGTYAIGAGSTVLSGGTLDFSKAAAITDFGAGGLSITDQFATLELGALDATTDSLTQTAGTIDGTGTLTVTGDAYFGNDDNTYDYQTGTGTTILQGQSGAQADIAVNDGRTLDNQGMFRASGSVINIGDGTQAATILNDTGGVFTAAGLVVFTTGAQALTSDEAFENKGLFRVDAGNTVNFNNYTTFHNDGTVELRDFSIINVGVTTFDGTGTITIGDGAELSTSGYLDASNIIEGGIGAGQTVIFGTGDRGTLNIQYGDAFNATIQGFVPGDVIDLDNADAVGATAGLVGNDLVVTDNANKKTYTFKLADPVAGETFSLTSIPAGGAGGIGIQVNPVAISTGWVPAGSGDWDNSANWGSGVPDGATTNAILGETGAPYTVTLGAGDTHTVGSLTLNSQGSVLAVAGSLDVENTLSLNNGTLKLGATDQSFDATAFLLYGGGIDGTGTLTIAGDAVLIAGTETGSGTTVIGNGATVDGTIGLDGGRTLEIKGVSTWTAGAINLGAVTGGGTLQIDSELYIENDVSITAGLGANKLVVNGVLRKQLSLGVTQIGAAIVAGRTSSIFVQTGTIEFDRGGTIAADMMGNTGTLTFGGGAFAINNGAIATIGKWLINGATVTFNETFHYGGKFTVNSASTLNIAAKDTLTLNGVSHLTGDVAGAGELDVSGSVIRDVDARTSNISAKFVDTGTLAIGAGIMSFTGTGDSFAGAVSGAGTLSFDGGTDAIDAGTPITVAEIDLNGGAAVTVNEDLAFAGPFVMVSGTSLGVAADDTLALSDTSGASILDGTLSGPGTVLVSGKTDLAGTTLSGGTLSNAGALTQNGDMSVTAGTLINQFGATWNSVNSAIAQGEGGTGTFYNAGTFENTADSAGVATIGVQFIDNGSVQVGNAMTFTGSGNSFTTGTISGDIGTLTFAGGDDTINGSLIITTAALSIASKASVTIHENLAYAGAFTMAAGTTLGIGTGQTLTLSGDQSSIAGTLAGPGTVAVAATGNVTLGATSLTHGGLVDKGTVNQNGDVTLGAGSIVNQKGALWGANGGFGIFLGKAGTGTFTNTGTFNKTSLATAAVGVDFIDTGTVTVGGGTLNFRGAANSFAGAISGDGSIEFGADSQSTFNAGASVDTAKWTIDNATAGITLNASIAYEGDFTVQSDGTVTIAAAKSLTLTDTETFGGSLVNGAGTLATTGTTGVTGPLTIGGTATWQNGGAATLSGAVTLGANAKNKATLINGAKGTIDITGADGVALGGASTSAIQNQGLFEKTGSAAVSHIGVNFTDRGALTIDAGTLEFDGAVNSFSGGIDGKGTLAFGGGVSTFKAGVSGDAGGVLIHNAGTEVDLATGIALGGQFSQLAGTTVALGNSALSLGGTSSLSGAITGTGAASALLIKAGTATVNSGFSLAAKRWSLASGVTLTDHVAVTYAGTFSAAAASLSLGGTLLSLTGAASFAGATVDGTGGLTTRGSTRVVGLTLGGAVKWLNYGTATETGAVTIGDAAGKTATITNEAKAVYDLAGNVGIAPAKGDTGSFSNAGTLEKTAGAGVSTIAVAVANSGAITVSGGTLDLTAAVTGTGTMTVSKGATLELDGAVAKTQTIAFGAGGGHLILSHPASFAGSVSGLGGASERIELIGFDTAAKKSFAVNAGKTGGTLTLTEGALTARITLFGQYVAGGFSLTTDHAGGVDLTYTAPKGSNADLAPHH